MLGKLKLNRYFVLDKNDKFFHDYFQTIITSSIYQRKHYHNKNLQQFRSICLSFLPKLRNIPVNIKDKSKYSAVIIDNRNDLMLEFMIRHMALQLQDICSFQIICFNSNHQFIKKLVADISPKINIIYFKNINIESVKDYNMLLKSKILWNHFKCEKVLIYQIDSYLFDNNIEEYFKYDYIGAPFYHKPCGLEMGNGGFSIRNVQLSKQIIDENPEFNYSNEDLYFSKNFIKKKAVLPSITKCINFSLENVYLDNINNYIGGHQFWFCLPNWKEILTKNLIAKYNITIP